MDPDGSVPLGLLGQRNQTEKPSTGAYNRGGHAQLLQRETKKLIQEGGVGGCEGRGRGGGGGARWDGNALPGSRVPVGRALSPPAPLFTVSWSRGQVCLGTSTHASREAARELPGSGGALGWMLSAASSHPGPGSFLPGPPTLDSLLPAPWWSKTRFPAPGHLAACGPREAMGQLGVPGRALRLHPRLRLGVCVSLEGPLEGQPFWELATWLQDELFPSLWVFSGWEWTEEGRGCCWPRRLPQAGFRRAAFSVLLAPMITGGFWDANSLARWRATVRSGGSVGDCPTVHRPLLSDLRPPLLSRRPLRGLPQLGQQPRRPMGGTRGSLRVRAGAPPCPVPPHRPELKNLPRYWEGGAVLRSGRNIKSYAGHQELADQ